MTILITGGAKRIGKLLCESLANAGHQVIIHYNHSESEALNLLKTLSGTGHSSIQKDLANPDRVEELFHILKNEDRLPDALINNASTFHRRGLNEFSSSELQEDYQINFFSPLLLMRDFKKFSKRGTIINILDRRVDTIEPACGPYLFAKKSLRDATLACANEWFPEIRVNAVAPGPVLMPEEEASLSSLTPQLKLIIDKVAFYLNSDTNADIAIIE